VGGTKAATPAAAVKDVNPTCGTMNCANCSVASDATLAGRRASALPGSATSAQDLALEYGRPWSAPSTKADIEATMLQAGPGARGIVFGDRTPVGGKPVLGHFFNVVNEGGTVHFVDGQSGGVADMTQRQAYQRFYVLRTN
jgi:filamentous hemagglutinin